MIQNYRDFLKKIYEARKAKNPGYSLVAFSRDAGFKSYHMNDIICGRYGLSPKRALVVAKNLKLSQLRKEEFLTLVQRDYAKSPIDKAMAEEKLKKLKMSADKTITDKVLPINSDWFYLATYEIFRKAQTTLTSEDVSKELSISVEDAQRAIEALPLLRNPQAKENKKVEILSVQTDTPSPSAILQKYHTQMIEKSLVSMKSDPVQERHFSSFNVYLTHDQYVNFTTELCGFIRNKILQYQESQDKNERLYAINVQTFPLQSKKQT